MIRPLNKKLVLCLMLAALMLGGCSRQWSNPDIEGKQQTDLQFDRDSTACNVMAGEQYPLDKRKQLEVYSKCMQDKGWVRSENTDKAVNFRK